MNLNLSLLQGYKTNIIDLINTVFVPFLIALAFAVFLWGVYTYFIKGAADEEARRKGRTFTLYGIIGFVIIFSLWGIIGIFKDTLNLNSSNSPTPPTIGGGANSGYWSFY